MSEIITLPTHRDLLAEVAAVRKTQRLSQRTISKEIGVSQAVVSQWLSGTYAGDIPAVEAKIRRWLDARHKRDLNARALPDAPGWVRTPSAARVMSALGYAQGAGDVSVIYGGAGLGKTTTCRQYQREAPNVWIATMTPATATVVPALEEIAYAVGIHDATGGGARIQRAIIRRLEDTQGLLIIDESQHLGVQALDTVRALHDATNVGIALVGNEAVYARMTGGNRAAYLDRLYSRIGKRVRLTGTTKRDVDALLAAWGRKVDDSRKLLLDIAMRPGGLRGVTKVLRMASMFAGGANHVLTPELIRHAWADLEGDNEVGGGA